MTEKHALLRALIAQMTDLSRADPATVSRLTHTVIHIIADALLRLTREHHRFRESDSAVLFEHPAPCMTRREANTFLCACFLEYRSGKTDVWDNVEFFVDEILDNPDNLWQEIVHHTYEGWHERFFDYNLHPEQGIHDRLYRIATNMIRFYAGDGRQIWGGYEDDPDEIYKRLLLLQIPPSTACLIVGTLKDLGYVHGPFDIVGDIVDARVLGRMVCGDGTCISSLSARRLARMLSPDDPWRLDRPLYLIGSRWCGPGPRCRACLVKEACVYAIAQELGIQPDPVVRESFFGRKSIQKTLKQWQTEEAINIQ